MTSTHVVCGPAYCYYAEDGDMTCETCPHARYWTDADFALASPPAAPSAQGASNPPASE